MIDSYFQEAEQYAKENNLLYMETSAKTALNVNDLFLQIGKKVLLPFLWHFRWQNNFSKTIAERTIWSRRQWG